MSGHRKVGRPKATLEGSGPPWETKSEEWLREWYERHRTHARNYNRKQRGMDLDLPVQNGKQRRELTVDELREKYKQQLLGAYARSKKKREQE